MFLRLHFQFSWFNPYYMQCIQTLPCALCVHLNSIDIVVHENETSENFASELPVANYTSSYAHKIHYYLLRQCWYFPNIGHIFRVAWLGYSQYTWTSSMEMGGQRSRNVARIAYYTIISSSNSPTFCPSNISIETL